jgi:hypothetical protein
MEKQKSIVLPVIIVVLIATVVFSGLVYYVINRKNLTESRTNSLDMANWKEYTNPKVHINFKYPPDMTFNDLTDSLDGLASQPVMIELDKTVDNPCGLENVPGCSHDGYVFEFRAIESGNEAAESFCHNTDASLLIGGVSGKITSEFHKAGEEGAVYQSACVTSGTYTYYFGFFVDKEVADSNKVYFDQLLQSVTFSS